MSCSGSLLTLSGFFASIINSERASFHDENCAGDAVTWARDRSRTLICAATWALTIGRIESYSDCEILARRRTRDEQGVVTLSRRWMWWASYLTRPSGIMEISFICSLSFGQGEHKGAG